MKAVSTIITRFILCLLALAPAVSPGQEEESNKLTVGAGLSTYVSCNNFGVFYSGYINCSRGKSTLSIGPCLQKRSMGVRGARVVYKYSVARYEGPDSLLNLQPRAVKCRLSFFSGMQYVNKLPLSYAAARIETITSVEGSVNWNEVKLSALEASAGVELEMQFRHCSGALWFGASTYYYFNYIPTMYHTRASPGLTAGLSVTIPQFKIKFP